MIGESEHGVFVSANRHPTSSYPSICPSAYLTSTNLPAYCLRFQQLPLHNLSIYYLYDWKKLINHQSLTESQGTLAEWLTRGPAKPVPSGARVRISQVSLFCSRSCILLESCHEFSTFLFQLFFSTRGSGRCSILQCLYMFSLCATTSMNKLALCDAFVPCSISR
jgi:hypothetical protein